MPSDRQGQLRLIPGSRVMWVNPACEWQGGSRLGCGDTIVPIRVQVHFPADFISTVNVCSHHMPHYLRILRGRKVEVV